MKQIFMVLAPLLLIALTPDAQANCSRHRCGINPQVTWQCDYSFVQARLKHQGRSYELDARRSTEPGLAAVLIAEGPYVVKVSTDLDRAEIIELNSLTGGTSLGTVECEEL